MRVNIWAWCGGGLAVILMVLALWGWRHAAEVATDAGRPYVAMWAVRSASIAAAAGAQGLLLTLVLGRLYRRQLLDDVLRLSAVLVFTVALVSAAALGLAGR